MFEWVIGVINNLGYTGVVFLMFLENVFPPIPSELVMPAAGAASAKGDLNLFGVIIAGTLGSVLGALPLYYLGAIIGQERLKKWAGKYGRWLTVSPAEIDQAKEWFDRHGNKTVLFCRLIPGVRSLISLPAGVSKMSLPKFLLYSAIGAGLWSGLLAFGGQMLGKNYDKIQGWLNPLSWIIVGVFVMIWIYRVVTFKK